MVNLTESSLESSIRWVLFSYRDGQTSQHLTIEVIIILSIFSFVEPFRVD